MRFRPLPVMTLFTVASLIILILLGNWQYERYSEKLARRDSEPAPLTSVRVEVDLSNDGYSQQVYGIFDGEAVWRRYVPGRINGEGPVVFVLWDAISGTEPIPLLISEQQTWENVANVFHRPAQTGGMASRSKPDEHIWYGFNAAMMLAQLGYDQDDALVVEPLNTVVRHGGDSGRSRETSNPYATLEVMDPLPPERHFGYALTWWGMAIGLLGVYFAYHHSKGRLRFRT